MFFEPELGLRFVRPVVEATSMVEVFLSTILVFAIRLRGERWRNEAWSEELEFRA